MATAGFSEHYAPTIYLRTISLVEALLLAVGLFYCGLAPETPMAK
jgi:hypothetical protein